MPAHDDGAHAVRWQPDQGSTTAQPELTKFYRLMKMHEWLANRPMRGSNRMKTIHIATSAKAAYTSGAKGRFLHTTARATIGKLAVDNNRRNTSDAILLRPFRVFLLVHVTDLNITG